ncbi:MAG: hypothetical protein ACRBI6_19755 [Acidimicrobiales bacterium]
MTTNSTVMLRTATIARHQWDRATDATHGRLERLAADNGERGDVTPRTIMVFIFAALALSVGAIIQAKVEGKANAISVD